MRETCNSWELPTNNKRRKFNICESINHALTHSQERVKKEGWFWASQSNIFLSDPTRLVESFSFRVKWNWFSWKFCRWKKFPEIFTWQQQMELFTVKIAWKALKRNRITRQWKISRKHNFPPKITKNAVTGGNFHKKFSFLWRKRLETSLIIRLQSRYMSNSILGF